LRKATVTVLAFALMMMLTAVIPALAKDFNVPEDVVVLYLEGGEGVIQVPTGWPGGDAVPTSRLKIEAAHVLVGPFGKDEFGITISINYSKGYVPVAYFTTNPDAVTFTRKVVSGLPATAPTNSKNVSKNDLIVERHGNRIAVSFVTPQTVKWTNKSNPTKVVDVVIPAFSFELDKIGGSVHDNSFLNMSGYKNASNYTATEEQMGFIGEGVFTCSAWSPATRPMTETFITMHGITTWYPPPPP
jgi:hypothetical protein